MIVVKIYDFKRDTSMPITQLKNVIEKSGALTSIGAEKEPVYSLAKISLRAYFPRSEFHARFGSLFSMTNTSTIDTYHRSDNKQLSGVKKADFKFKGNQSNVLPRMYPKTGNFYNPFHFSAYQRAVKIEDSPATHLPDPATWYDKLLTYQKEMAHYIVDKIRVRDPSITVNADYEYTCVLLHLTKPAAEKNDATWTQLIGVYLIAIANKLAYERGINIELHRRASFGCLRPAVAECGESLRITLGLCPKDYADCLVDGIIYLKQLFIEPQHFALPVTSTSLRTTLEAYNKGKSTVKKTVSIQLKDTRWDTLWAPADSKNCSFASQLFRKAFTVEHLIDQIFDACLANPISEIMQDKSKLQHAFVLPLQNLFKSYKLTHRGSLSILPKEKELSHYHWIKEGNIDDERFWAIIGEFSMLLGANSSDIGLIVSNKKATHLHCFFEHLLTDFFFKPKNVDEVTDGYGSDSDEEDEVVLEKDKAMDVYAKKLITATGMRAIQLVYAAARDYLTAIHQVDPLYIECHLPAMYYETADALHHHAIPVDVDNTTAKRTKGVKMTFFDLNHCNKTNDKVVDFVSEIGDAEPICIIDVTSATTTEMHKMLQKIFLCKNKLEIVVFVSSGLKNEQAMSDLNPYGTVRIFSRTAESLAIIYNKLTKLEDEAGYSHPRISHLLRKSAKQFGMTPTNASILVGASTGPTH